AIGITGFQVGAQGLLESRATPVNAIAARYAEACDELRPQLPERQAIQRRFGGRQGGRAETGHDQTRWLYSGIHQAGGGFKSQQGTVAVADENKRLGGSETRCVGMSGERLS